ncbi:uncharacterized protein ACBT44_018537 [Syngnathus typhle]
MEMFPNGRLDGQDERNLKDLDVLPQSLMVEHSLNIPQVNDKLESNQSLSQSCSDCESAMEETLPQIIKKLHIEDVKQDEEQGSSNLVDHILKELKGINKIQEEISDLRQYLTSVRGSVDEVSCCVDAVLSEIGELYSGASAAPYSSPLSQSHRLRRGSLGRQNAVTSPLKRPTSPLSDCKKTSHGPSKQSIGGQITLQSNQQPIQDKELQSSNIQELFRLPQGQDYQRNHSLSSCDYSRSGFICIDPENDRWPSEHFSTCGEGGWSESEPSYGNIEEPHVWDDCCPETQSNTPGPSSGASSEHLSLLFGIHYNSPACSPSLDKCQNTEGRCSSISGSCSNIFLTDCDGGDLCDDYTSSGDTLELGSGQSLDQDWTDHSISKDDGGESASQHSLEVSSSVGFDLRTFSKAVLNFKSSVKGAWKMFDGLNPDDLDDDILEASLPVITHTDVSNDHTPCVPTTEVSEVSDVQDPGKISDKPSCSVQSMEQESGHSLSIVTDRSDEEIIQIKEDYKTNSEMPDLYLNPNDCPVIQAESPLDVLYSSDEVPFSCPPENMVEEVGKPLDSDHKARIANFQRVLREKKQIHQRLSQSTQGSQGSCGSQGSQGFRSQEMCIKETVQEENQVAPILLAPY